MACKKKTATPVAPAPEAAAPTIEPEPAPQVPLPTPLYSSCKIRSSPRMKPCSQPASSWPKAGSATGRREGLA